MWIESHSDVWKHFKTRRLSKLIDATLPTTVGHLLSLWHFTLDNAWQSGDLERWGDDGIEEGARWNGEPGKLIKSLRDAGYICEGQCDGTNKDGECQANNAGYSVHSWFDYAGELVRKKRTRVMRKAAAQAEIVEGAGPEFEKFWSAYPETRRAHRAESAKAWIELAPDSGLIGRIHEALTLHKNSIEWQRDGGAFICLPDTWLKKQRWEDKLRPLPTIPGAPIPKCASCFSGQRAPGALYCKTCAWCHECDRTESAQRFAAHELVPGPDGSPSCPNHAVKVAAGG